MKDTTSGSRQILIKTPARTKPLKLLRNCSKKNGANIGTKNLVNIVEGRQTCQIWIQKLEVIKSKRDDTPLHARQVYEHSDKCPDSDSDGGNNKKLFDLLAHESPGVNMLDVF